MTVRKMMEDPNDLTRLTDLELLEKMMRVAIKKSDYKAEHDMIGFYAADKVLDRLCAEAKRRMSITDPVLRDANG